MRILCESTYPRSTAGARVRIVQHSPYLARHGVELVFRSLLSPTEYECITEPGLSGKKLLSASRMFARAAQDPGCWDLRMIYRLRTLMNAGRLDSPRELAIYDFDDALHIGLVSNANTRFARLKAESQRWRRYVSSARLVLAGNSYLASAARSIARRVEIIPSCVDPFRQPTRKHGDRETLRLGWVGSRTTSVYLRSLIPALDGINTGSPPIELICVGARLPEKRPWITETAWSEDTEAAILASFDIGIMPLPDDPWTRGKCGYKLLQYMAAGVPFVASPVGVNKDMVDLGAGLAATGTADWRAAIRQLSSASVRAELGARGRHCAEQHYSFEVWSPRLAQLFLSLSA